jgi:hypothetical protein
VSSAATARRAPRRLGHYAAPGGASREIVCKAGFDGSLLVIDRDVATRRQGRLVAHLGADEPPENAALICEHYLRDGVPVRCRAVTAADLSEPPFTEPARSAPTIAPASYGSVGAFCLRRLKTGMSIPELRWTVTVATGAGDGVRAVSLREAIGALESYEPLRRHTRRALRSDRGDPAISTVVLAAELERVLESPIVLNRALREAVLERVRRDGISMSEIAIRCGRVKRDRNGNLSGETSWLARRVGLLAEGGQGGPTRWIHTAVLGLIARDGLGIAPREVELG